jgi:hypothetical protein
MKKLVLLHRWLGVIACVAVLMFAGSGILHPVMSRLQPKPAQFAAPAVAFAAAPLPLREVLAQHGVASFAQAIAVQLPQGAAYRIQLGNGAVRYFNAATGAEIRDGELLHAQHLARYFLGDDGVAIARSERVTAFDDEYVFVNRLLPAWRIQFGRGDGITAYVDTAGNRLATLNDNAKRSFQIYFRALHDFNCLDRHNALRVGLMLVLLLAAFATAVAGLVMFVRLRRANQRLAQLPARRWHRRLALAISISTFSFALSGALHLLQSLREQSPRTAPASQFRTDEIGNALVDRAFTLQRVNGVPCYRIASATRAGMAGGEHHQHAQPARAAEPTDLAQCLDTHTGNPLANAEKMLAEQLARYYSGNSSAVISLTAVTRFEGEYGFINKRLPVWRVQFAGDSTRWYVEPLSGALALRADNSDAFEGTVFSLLHKARFIGDENKNLRDALLMLFAFGNIVVALLGLWVFVRRLRRA